jgi:hypothetical protein
MPAHHSCYRLIDAVLARLRNRQEVIGALDRKAIETLSHDCAKALRLTLLASEMRDDARK